MTRPRRSGIRGGWYRGDIAARPAAGTATGL